LKKLLKNLLALGLFDYLFASNYSEGINMYILPGVLSLFDKNRLQEKLQDDYEAFICLIDKERFHLKNLNPSHSFFELDEKIPYLLMGMPHMSIFNFFQDYYSGLRESVTQELRNKLEQEGLYAKLKNDSCVSDPELEKRLEQQGLLEMVRTHCGTLYSEK
jgi:hypothetical protein